MSTAEDNDIEYKGERKVRISSNAIEKLTKIKTVIKCKDGVAQVDKSHPDYNFWVEY